MVPDTATKTEPGVTLRLSIWMSFTSILVMPLTASNRTLYNMSCNFAMIPQPPFSPKGEKKLVELNVYCLFFSYILTRRYRLHYHFTPAFYLYLQSQVFT